MEKIAYEQIKIEVFKFDGKDVILASGNFTPEFSKDSDDTEIVRP